MMEIRSLDRADAAAFQALRLCSLRECPTAFLSSYEEECITPLEQVADRLAPTSDQRTFGAFENAALIGIVGLRRESFRKASHKGYLWGVYIAAGYRRHGIGRLLVAEALAFAETMPGLRRLNLFVSAPNLAAIALYESLGFQAYGIERESVYVDGAYHDEILMARTLP